MTDEKNLTLDDVNITEEELNEKKQSLKSGERIVEVQENKYETVTRMNG